MKKLTIKGNTKLTFGQAIELLKAGKKVQRVGWNGKGMWLSLVRAGQWQVAEEVPGLEDRSLLTAPWIAMKAANNDFIPWVASQTDVLAEDWAQVG
jgi:hypothetical protein